MYSTNASVVINDHVKQSSKEVEHLLFLAFNFNRPESTSSLNGDTET